MTQLTIKDIMTRDVIAVAPDTSRTSAARLLAQEEITGAPVIDRDGRVVGVVSLRDLNDPDADTTGREGHPVFYRILDGWAEEYGDITDSVEGRVDEVMTASPITGDAHMSITGAASLMLDAGIHRLVVVEDNSLVGIVTTTDILRALIQ